MSDIIVNKPNKPNRAEHWVTHIKCWDESKLSQPEYCKQAGIGYSHLGIGVASYPL
jgi:hypothetical protein